MITDMSSCVKAELESGRFDGLCDKERTVSLATGLAASEHIGALAELLEQKFPALKVNVYPIKNEFFGDKITVSGLLTGKDITSQLGDKELGDELLIPSACLRAEGDVLLDDMSPEDISRSLGGIKVSPADNDAVSFILSVLGRTDAKNTI